MRISSHAGKRPRPERYPMNTVWVFQLENGVEIRTFDVTSFERTFVINYPGKPPIMFSIGFEDFPKESSPTFKDELKALFVSRAMAAQRGITE